MNTSIEMLFNSGEEKEDANKTKERSIAVKKFLKKEEAFIEKIAVEIVEEEYEEGKKDREVEVNEREDGEEEDGEKARTKAKKRTPSMERKV
jgi:hypothetical protein